MPEYREVIDTIEVPKSIGIEGFLKVIRSILKIPRIQKIEVDVKGHVSYKHFALDGEKVAINENFDGMEPYNIVRNSEVEELTLNSTNASNILILIMDKISSDRLCPIAFVLGSNSRFWKWYEESSGSKLSSQNNICGLPIFTDRQIPDSALIACAAYTKDAALIDAQKSYKVEMHYLKMPETKVDIL